jgi:hypothetical protein
MDKVKKLTNEQVLKELERLSVSKKTLDKDITKVKEKKKIDRTIFEKPKKPKIQDYLSLETITKLHDFIKDRECRATLKGWIKKYNQPDDSSSSTDSD